MGQSRSRSRLHRLGRPILEALRTGREPLAPPWATFLGHVFFFSFMAFSLWHLFEDAVLGGFV